MARPIMDRDEGAASTLALLARVSLAACPAFLMLATLLTCSPLCVNQLGRGHESLASERIRIPHEYSWRGAPGGGRRTRIFSPRLLLHIRSPVYVLCRTKCPEAHTFCNNGVAFITKRADLLRQKEVGSFFVVGRYRRGAAGHSA